ncbi:hypothetical protein [uncultured Roseobacter sp.]|uniref:hypothetical protein n=1 Tax=uncultured Roseobacter sp. TaxID=114847 RepID=UPI0026311A52|nr:hypothetical protein [uncultured Roseobacter sp.]
MTHTLSRRLRQAWAALRAASRGASFDRDPLAHPDIARMSERERADLPFCPARVKPD